MTRTISLVAALHDRMALVAQAMAERVSPGAWAGYRATEGLEGRYTKPASLGGAPTLDYHRPGEPRATIALGFLEMTHVEEESRDPPLVIRGGIEERKAYEVRLPSGVSDTKTVEHEFERTTSFAESAKKAWEAGAKASLGVEYAGVKGAVEAFGKYGEELSRQDSGSERTRDLIRDEFSFTGPVDTFIDAFRARNRQLQVVRARADFDGKIYWQTGETAWEFTTFRTQFLPVAKRIADDSIYGYDEFMKMPLSDAEIAAIEAPSGKVIEFVAEYDNVVTESLLART